MTTAKKATKKPVKKTALKKTTKASVKKPVAKKTVKKSALVKKKSATSKKKTLAKKPIKKTKVAAKKTTVKKTAVKKAVTKKTGTKTAVTKKVAPQKTNLTKKAVVKKNMTQSLTKEIIPPQHSTVKEDSMLDITMDDLDLEVAPYEIEKGADYMTEEQLEHFRKILLRWKHQLMQEVDSTVGHMQEDGLSYPDPIDRASQEEGFNLELRTRDRERKLIKKIESAIDSIETGEYGYCADCGAEIGVRRLEARPTADKCIDCKTYEEIREKQAGGL